MFKVFLKSPCFKEISQLTPVVLYITHSERSLLSPFDVNAVDNGVAERLKQKVLSQVFSGLRLGVGRQQSWIHF
jgi:hypothetical protein